MTSPSISTQSYARTAGFLYLLIAVAGGFSIGYVPSVIIQTGDAAATATNLAANIGLFRLGLLGDIVVLLAEVVLTAMLYVMFRPVSPTLSLVAAWSRLAMVMVMAVNLVINAMPMLLLNGSAVAGPGEAGQLQAIAMLFFDAHQVGIYVWQLFFAMHLLALGYMIVRSSLFPRLLGWMMMVGSFGYLIQGLAEITDSQNASLSVLYIALLVVVTVGELAFALWLLIRGVRTAT
jgi:Domain of unknown function (DUF4386)